MGVQSNNSELTSDTAGEPSKLRRTFTLPRNPFGSVRISKRKYELKENEDVKQTAANGDLEKNKKVFRHPSIRKFINKIAQHINGVNVINNENRVPPVGLQTWGPDETPGVTGLVNHGNTCFINAVLQCIAHTDILAEYFVLDKYKVDLSKRNKLNSKKFGSKGELTEQLALLLKALWACKYHPELTIAFKQVVEKYGSQYKGRQQHDALEFLQWLLDKVHEDLNTASKRKFKSVKTSGRPDEVIAAETLENYKRCNNSFIQGVFQAQYRSSLSCSRCQNQSNTFDPFQCISVQLPQVSKQSVYVTVLYTSQQPRQVQIGLSIPSGSTISELREMLESDTGINRAGMLVTEITDSTFHRTFTDQQCVNSITEIDPIYCIEVPRLKDVEDDTTSAYVLLCWINVTKQDDTHEWKRFGSPYCMQVSRETSYDDLQKLLLKEMAVILHDDVLTLSQSRGIFKIRISDPACDENEPACYLEPELEHPLFMEALDQALALCSEDGGPAHVKLILEWDSDSKQSLIADDGDIVEEHSSVKQLRAQDMHGAPLTLEECLRDYTGAETLSDAWRCTHCQQYQPVIKTLGVWSLPDILIVHFKRFRQQNVRGTSSTKLTTMVDFPVCGFDMTPHLVSKSASTNTQNFTNNGLIGQNIDGEYVNAQNSWSPWKKTRKHSTPYSDNIYDLYAVCYHHGTNLGTGHYTAACKNPYDSQWYLYDDSKVTNLSKQSDDIYSLLVNNSAYILFYQRRNGYYSNSNSSNSSSAASTSSIGSNDHWVTRMPKFMAPKHLRNMEHSSSKPVIKVDGADENNQNGANEDNVIAQKNSENNLKNEVTNCSSQSIPKYIDGSTSTIDELDGSQVMNGKKLEEVTVESNDPKENDNSNAFPKSPTYTTSIYINASGEAAIKTTTNYQKSPILSPLRTSNNERSLNVELKKEQTYFSTTATLYRHSDLNWMSPRPQRKLQDAHQSI